MRASPPRREAASRSPPISTSPAQAPSRSGTPPGLGFVGRIDFEARAPGLVLEAAGVRTYTTGVYVVEAMGLAMDWTAIGMPMPFEQTGAGRYLLSLDQYEDARDAAWGPKWLEGAAGGPKTGLLTVSGLDWVDNRDGTWSATGEATIGLENAGPDLLRIRNGTFLLI